MYVKRNTSTNKQSRHKRTLGQLPPVDLCTYLSCLLIYFTYTKWMFVNSSRWCQERAILLMSRELLASLKERPSMDYTMGFCHLYFACDCKIFLWDHQILLLTLQWSLGIGNFLLPKKVHLNACLVDIDKSQKIRVFIANWNNPTHICGLSAYWS